MAATVKRNTNAQYSTSKAYDLYLPNEYAVVVLNF